MLWNRAYSNMASSPGEAPAPSGPAAVSLVARDDRDLGDDGGTSTGYPDALQATPRSASQKRDQSDTIQDNEEERRDQPAGRLCRVFITPENAEPFTGDCPVCVCMVEYVSGQVTCTTCGYEPLPVEAPAQQKMIKSWLSFTWHPAICQRLTTSRHNWRAGRCFEERDGSSRPDESRSQS